jgi:hypothetical protein
MKVISVSAHMIPGVGDFKMVEPTLQSDNGVGSQTMESQAVTTMFPVDLLDRLALGFDAEEPTHNPCHQEPAAKISKCLRMQRHIRLLDHGGLPWLMFVYRADVAPAARRCRECALDAANGRSSWT